MKARLWPQSFETHRVPRRFSQPARYKVRHVRLARIAINPCRSVPNPEVQTALDDLVDAARLQKRHRQNRLFWRS